MGTAPAPPCLLQAPAPHLVLCLSLFLCPVPVPSLRVWPCPSVCLFLLLWLCPSRAIQGRMVCGPFCFTLSALSPLPRTHLCWVSWFSFCTVTSLRSTGHRALARMGQGPFLLGKAELLQGLGATRPGTGPLLPTPAPRETQPTAASRN